MVAKAKVFKSGNSQAVRLPKEFRFDVDEVDIRRDGDVIILSPPVEKKEPWADLKAFWASRGFSDDFMKDGRQQGEFDERPELDRLFESADEPVK